MSQEQRRRRRRTLPRRACLLDAPARLARLARRAGAGHCRLQCVSWERSEKSAATCACMLVVCVAPETRLLGSLVWPAVLALATATCRA